MTILNMYTDGACSGNQNEKNIGGWGCILEFGANTKELHGGELNTTNNRMEIEAVIAGFRALKQSGLTVRVFTDSSYVANCFRQKWYVKWRASGWMTAGKRPVSNRSLWEELLALTEKHRVQFYRVKGHTNLQQSEDKLQILYRKFLSNNGKTFSFDDFLKITAMNNRADALANIAMDELRK